ncbi:MAG TPA: stage III sporulation protein AE [Feifaniaceae bacterium]|nr:stage III sporulation protein AE [Feifaniaceae bacterium]
MKKRGAVLAVLALALLLVPVRALAQPPQEIVDGVQSALDGADVGKWNETYSALPEDVKALWGGKDLYTLISGYALGEGEYLGGTVQEALAHLLKSMLPDVLPMIVSLLAIAVLSGFLRAMSEANMSGVNEIAAFVCQCFAIGVAMVSFLSLADIARDTIERTSTFMELAFPPLLTMLTAAGGIASAGIFQPAMTMLCSGVSVALQKVVLPVILTGGVLGMLNNITGKVQLGQLFHLSKTVAKWMIGLISTLYFGVTSLQGLTAATFDGVSIRTAKFALDKMVPIVGGMVSGTVDTVLGCAVLVKNAAGVAAILITFGIVVVPLLRIAVGMLSFRLAAAVCEPIAEPRIPKMLASIGDVLTYLFAAAASLSVMFMITVGLIMGAGNAAIG